MGADFRMNEAALAYDAQSARCWSASMGAGAALRTLAPWRGNSSALDVSTVSPSRRYVRYRRNTCGPPIEVGSSPGPSFAMTGCIGFQPAHLTGENKPGLGGSDKLQLIRGSRPASTVFSFDCRWHSLLVSILLPPSVQLTLMRKNPEPWLPDFSSLLCSAR